jgi:hypothetical protein
LTFRVAANSGGPRTGTLTIGDRTHTVSQQQAGENPPTPAPAPAPPAPAPAPHRHHQHHHRRPRRPRRRRAPTRSSPPVLTSRRLAVPSAP